MIKKKPVNLTLPENLVQETKIQAVRENRTFSEIVEQLLKEYLESQKRRKKSKS
jgi:metal-responsive CopG/Arc/MetJ family transcriptional regulator